MSYGIMRVEKAKLSDLGGLEAEANRDEKNKKDFKASAIDWDRTPDNKYLVRSNGWKYTAEDLIKKYGCKVRKDSTYLIDCIITASGDFFTTQPPEKVEAFFEDAVKFAGRHFGKVINAVIHKDESTPHIHIASVPIVEKEPGKYSLSAKALLGGVTDIHKLQDTAFKELFEPYGLERGVTREEKVKNLKVLDYKLVKREEEVKAAEADKVDLESKCAALEKRIGTLERIGGIIDFITDKIEAVFNRISDAINTGIDKLCSLIERREPVREADLNQADCKMVRCGKITFKDTGENDPLYCPKTNAGTPVTWNGVKPVALQDEDGAFLFGWKKDESGIAYCPPEEWGKNFNQDNRDELPEREDDDRDYIERGIGAIKYIIDGEPETLEDLEEMEPPEEIDYNDTEIEPQEGKEEDGEDSIDGFID